MYQQTAYIAHRKINRKSMCSTCNEPNNKLYRNNVFISDRFCVPFMQSFNLDNHIYSSLTKDLPHNMFLR